MTHSCPTRRSSDLESDGETSGDATGELVVRFSSLATAGVILASVSGSILGWNEVRSLEGLTTTGYGLLLLSKVSAVGGMAGLGAYNHYRLIPALRKGKRRAALRQMRTSLALRSEEHTSELQSLMRISYAVFCLKKKRTKKQPHTHE